MTGFVPTGYTIRLPCGCCCVRYRPDHSPSLPWTAYWIPRGDWVRGDIPFSAATCVEAYDKLMQDYPCNCAGHTPKDAHDHRCRTGQLAQAG